MTRAGVPSDPATAEAVGEIRGQLREMIHTMNSQGQRLILMSEAVAQLQTVPADISEIKERLAALEADKLRREGASGVLSAVAKSPAIAWFVGAVVTAWAVLSGKVPG